MSQFIKALNMDDATEQDKLEYEKHIWSTAIEAVIQKLKEDFVAPDVMIEIIREVKK